MTQYLTVFDTSIATDNLGDEIIMASVNAIVRSLYPGGFVVRVPTHDKIGPRGRQCAENSDVAFVGGTNLLCSNWLFRSQWKIGASDFWRIGHPILLGVGWRYYQNPTDPVTAAMLRYLLKNSRRHSVRDSYTATRLRDMGINNVLNTGCPTMWGLTEELCAKVPVKRAEDAIITVTAYSSRNPDIDRKWIDLVCSKYRKVYFWPQMYGDLAYIQSISEGRLTIVDMSLAGYDSALESCDVDYIGTRLHGGVRALQKGRRALIIEIDNRAKEISRDTNLPTIERDDLARLATWIDDPVPTRIKMPWDVIAEWKAQFL